MNAFEQHTTVNHATAKIVSAGALTAQELSAERNRIAAIYKNR